jgi:magnesium-transporting ATPase (P-type)
VLALVRPSWPPWPDPPLVQLCLPSSRVQAQEARGGLVISNPDSIAAALHPWIALVGLTCSVLSLTLAVLSLTVSWCLRRPPRTTVLMALLMASISTPINAYFAWMSWS